MASKVENGKQWLITGGCGFIGTALIKRILEERSGDRVRVLDNLSVGTREDLWRIVRGAGRRTPWLNTPEGTPVQQGREGRGHPG